MGETELGPVKMPSWGHLWLSQGNHQLTIPQGRAEFRGTNGPTELVMLNVHSCWISMNFYDILSCRIDLYLKIYIYILSNPFKIGFFIDVWTIHIDHIASIKHGFPHLVPQKFAAPVVKPWVALRFPSGLGKAIQAMWAMWAMSTQGMRKYMYPMVNKHSYWKWWFSYSSGWIPSKNGDFP